jgi:enoyl-CoA hydratase/carnithine racemase
MILTGRGVDAKEALSMGLANRVVPKGKALDEAMKIAEQLIRFPQNCMNVDRESCYFAKYEATSFEDAMAHEFDHGITVIDAESVKGAARFSSGIGRHGSFEKL